MSTAPIHFFYALFATLFIVSISSFLLRRTFAKNKTRYSHIRVEMQIFWRERSPRLQGGRTKEFCRQRGNRAACQNYI